MTRVSTGGGWTRRLGVPAVALIMAGTVFPPAAAAETSGRPGAAAYGGRPFAAAPVAPLRAGEGDPDPGRFGLDGKVGVHASAISDDMLVGGGATDPVAESAAGVEWVRRLMIHQTTFLSTPLLLAVLPDTPHARRVLTSLKDAAEELP